LNTQSLIYRQKPETRQLHLKKLADAGVQVAMFVSSLRAPLRGRTNLRNQRKVVTSDGVWM
jgi:hypothetical protein